MIKFQKSFLFGFIRKVRQIILPPEVNPYKGITYFGNYKNFELAKFNNKTTRYHSVNSLKKEVALGREHSQNYHKNNVRLNETRCIKVYQHLELHYNKYDNLLDIGTSFNPIFLHEPINFSQEIEIIMYDIPEVIKTLKKLYPERESKFIDNINSIESKVDLVNFGSSLQYFDKWMSFLGSVANLNPKTIMIIDTAMGENIETFVCLQVNTFPRVIPRYVFSKPELIGILDKLKYTLIKEDMEIKSRFHNYPNSYHSIFHQNLIFEKFKE